MLQLGRLVNNYAIICHYQRLVFFFPIFYNTSPALKAQESNKIWVKYFTATLGGMQFLGEANGAETYPLVNFEAFDDILSPVGFKAQEATSRSSWFSGKWMHESGNTTIQVDYQARQSRITITTANSSIFAEYLAFLKTFDELFDGAITLISKYEGTAIESTDRPDGSREIVSRVFKGDSLIKDAVEFYVIDCQVSITLVNN
ncbi:MAG: hypothetical protein IPL46_19470 [Saprospiraceae bacterium]|nr:hypothetical protein [Saprospiraceae bacterium]